MAREMSSEAGCELKRRRAEVLSILTEGLPRMPGHLRRLSALLAASPVDLKQVAAVIRKDRRLTARLFRWSEPLRRGPRNGNRRIEEAAILMGTERLKNLVFANYLLLLAGDRLPEPDLEAFRVHSLSAGALSEVAARAAGYDDVERSYLGGLIHDAGKLPLLMASANAIQAGRDARDDFDSLRLERERFGFDHCQVGRGLAVAWNFDAGLIEVLEWHHQPLRARFDPELVGIVAAVDHFLDMAEKPSGGSPFAADGIYRACFPGWRVEQVEDLVSLLGREYPRARRQAALWSPEPDVHCSTGTAKACG